jgi:NAD(P)-dependent dehydrogenase (short-subunit alcohol dehydrogenase family)
MTDFVARKPYFDEGPVALIIGCGDMGTAAARAIGKRHPLMIVDIDAPRLERKTEDLRLDGYTVSGRPLDVTDPAQVEAFGASLAGGPGVKVLAHVAGVGGPRVGVHRMLAVDLFGPHLVAKAVIPHMVRGGVIIQIASLAGYQAKADPRIDKLLDDPLKPGFAEALFALHGGEPDFLASYAYAKLGVIRFSEKLAVALGPREIRAVTVTPGMIDTSIGRNDGASAPAGDGSGTMVSRAEKAREIPLARQGTINEIAAAIDFIASDAASFINGVELLVDGGHRAGWRDRGVIER